MRQFKLRTLMLSIALSTLIAYFGSKAAKIVILTVASYDPIEFLADPTIFMLVLVVVFIGLPIVWCLALSMIFLLGIRIIDYLARTFKAKLQ